MKAIFFHSKFRYLCSFLMGLFLIALKMILENDYTSLITYCNGTFLAGFMLLCFGGLSVVNFYGGFDIFQCMVAKADENGHKPTLNEFSQMKREKRSANKYVFVPYFTVGFFYLIISLILTVIFNISIS